MGLKVSLYLVAFSVLIRCYQCANILVVISVPMYSHQATFRPLWRELHAKGHHLTILTTHPMQDASLKNITEIDLPYDTVTKTDLVSFLADETRTLGEINVCLYNLFIELMVEQLHAPKVQELLRNDRVKFDLAFVEILTPSLGAFGWKFKCPWIGLSTLDAPIAMHHTVGNPIHPILYPDRNLLVGNVEDLTFPERVSILFSTIFNVIYFYINVLPRNHKAMQKYFGADLPPIHQILKEMSLMFINIDPVLFNVPPLSINTVAIGEDIHISPPKDLPQELQIFLDNSKNGVIYFSLGTNVGDNLFTADMKKAFMDAFTELPFEILFRFDEDVPYLPPNVKLEKWVPQQDVLRHPKVRLFITQAELQSIHESINSFVPMVCIPFLGDQFQNSQRMANRGVAVRLKKGDVTKDSVKGAIFEVLNHANYREKAIELGMLLRDQPITGLKKAVWWTEYVIRNEGAKHLRSPQIKIPWYQYYLLDIMSFLSAVTFAIIYLFYKISLIILGIYSKFCKVLYKLKKS